MWWQKAAYVASFGLAPHFSSILHQRVNREKYFVLLYDESLNSKMQTKQMDIHVRIWLNNCVTSRFLTSEFMHHATADDLKCFEHATEKINKQNLIKVSMDGPAVNWKFFSSLQESVKALYQCSLIDIESCGLHIVHGAVKHVLEATGWNIDDLLYAFLRLLKDAPARQEDYYKANDNKSPPMPLKFCATRWVENTPVIE